MAGIVVAGHVNVEDTFMPGGRAGRGGAGGAAVYAAVGARLAAASDVSIVGRIGHDFPAAILAALADAGVGLALEHVDLPTMRSTNTYDRNGVRRYRMHNPPEDLVALTPRAEEVLRVAADAYHLGPLPASIGLAIRHGTSAVIGLDSHPAFVERERATFSELAMSVELLLLSEAEWTAWRGSRSVQSWIESALPGPAVIVVKRGGDGATALGAGESRLVEVPALAVTRVVDPTGAGDAFCGAFMAEWLRSGDVVRATVLASAVASIVMEDFGAIPALVRTRDVIRRADSLSHLVTRRAFTRSQIPP